MHNTTEQMSLDNLLSLKELFLEQQNFVNHSLEQLNTLIEEKETNVLIKQIEAETQRRQDLPLSLALVEFAYQKKLINDNYTKPQIKKVLYNYLMDQTILDFFLQYTKDGLDLINELCSAIEKIDS